MSEQTFTIRTRKFQSNPLLQRKQFCIDVMHPNQSTISKKDLQGKLASMYKVQDPKSIVLFGFKTAFGGGRTSGFGLIYDNFAAAKKFEMRYKLVRMGAMDEKSRTGRRGRKETKNRAKKCRGKEKAKVLGKK
uniref:40S ribosomal protein S24 n=1 Tax=Chromera velia CCMP2878 TaxID=1169474 RepID=A0A0G4FHI6_9ALVE|mmetsp:Transcript_54032/g.105688  ORF Transcript_54032/g.105688 Transcript_54032/m.105688 type:complete len:133 (-) Transcript_54032:438-836(-)|eukprot:Cvel_16959.t1-p1 / transcript=Cvel_16959.t1 / gene=Cvel_16959 / organism=Chromera_velia_CCMP2878 / gene_product=40S ribosomal protein S24-1, putative / transcript_product=40S ribosomal protein S24-1, putative / location=Cvel_scaffold1330:40054-40553(+) / protein_length=132 / sequence_SO=supercontig / SO=protein_coding / is_pseudo=false